MISETEFQKLCRLVALQIVHGAEVRYDGVQPDIQLLNQSSRQVKPDGQQNEENLDINAQ